MDYPRQNYFSEKKVGLLYSVGSVEDLAGGRWFCRGVLRGVVSTNTSVMVYSTASYGDLVPGLQSAFCLFLASFEDVLLDLFSISTSQSHPIDASASTSIVEFC